jgi:hypothetical protein
VSEEPLRVDDLVRESRIFEAGVSAHDGLQTLFQSRFPRLQRAYHPSILGLIALAYSSSALHRLGEGGVEAARKSWLYRWLTTEPKPDVIVIDLRETLTVGPILAILERVIAPLSRATSRSSSTLLARRVAAAPIPVASAALLGLILVMLVRTWPPTPLFVGGTVIAILAAVIGMRVENSREALSESRLVDLLRMVLSPPEEMGR